MYNTPHIAFYDLERVNAYLHERKDKWIPEICILTFPSRNDALLMKESLRHDGRFLAAWCIRREPGTAMHWHLLKAEEECTWGNEWQVQFYSKHSAPASFPGRACSWQVNGRPVYLHVVTTQGESWPRDLLWLKEWAEVHALIVREYI